MPSLEHIAACGKTLYGEGESFTVWLDKMTEESENAQMFEIEAKPSVAATRPVGWYTVTTTP